MASTRPITRSGELSTASSRLSHLARNGVAALALFSAAGCAGESATQTSSTPPVSSHAPAPHSTTGPSPSEVHCQLPGASLAATRRYSGSVALSPLVGETVRLGAHDCYDSFVIELGGAAAPNALPGAYAHYVDGPVKAEPADRAVTVRGAAHLQITVGSAMYARGGGAGPQRIASATVPHIEEAVLTENFEGTSTWTLGLEQQRPFTVTDVSGTAHCPVECLVVNIAH